MDHKISNGCPQTVLKDELALNAGPFGRMVLSVIMLLCFDLLAVALSALIAIYLRNSVLPLISGVLFPDKLLTNTMQLLWWYPLAFIFSFSYEKLYHKRLPFWVEVEWIMRASTLALFMTIAFIYISGIGSLVSRAVVFIIWLLALILIPAFRFYGKKLLLKLKLWSCPLILIGDLASATLVARALDREKTMGYYLVGYINGHCSAGDHDPKSSPTHPVACLGEIGAAEDIISAGPVRDIIIALPGLPADDLVEMANRFQPLVNNVLIIPDLFGITLNGIEITYFFEEQVILLQIRNRLNSLLNRTKKRLFDLLLGLILLALASPVLIAAAMAVYLTSPGPAFFVQERMGQGGVIFKTYKFRTMYTDCDQILKRHLTANLEASIEWEKYKKLKGMDPRVTSVGLLLRRYSLDELPQIFNVVKNDMSLVGPRPYLPRESDDMGGWASDILVTKPGLTGLWQVSGRNNLSFKSRLRLDSWYVRNWSMWLDIMLILRTFRVVLKTDGAH